jgi:epoxyqueuosine reductase
MTPDQTAGLICSELEERGYRGTVVPIEHVAQLRYEIEENVNQGKIDVGLYERYLAGFEFDITTRLPKACSIIITAAPQPQRKVTFHFNGQTYPVIIPPTYYYDTDAQIRNTLQNVLNSNDYQLYPAALPSKLLAVCSGMAKYGKNNIAYVEGLGSFVRLSITFLNEGNGEFPEWVDPAWHNSLVGCMKCQLVCPVNKRLIKWVEEGEDFNEAETELILSGVPLDRIPSETAHKLKRCYMHEYLDVLPRNLRAFLK